MDLLETLTRLLGCEYLSDLHRASATPAQAQAIRDLPDGEFSAADCQEAADYILGRHIPCASAAEARQLIAAALLERSR